MFYYERIRDLCSDRGITMISVEEALGMSRGTINKMKTSEPSFARMCDIADYFGVSLDYFRKEAAV